MYEGRNRRGGRREEGRTEGEREGKKEGPGYGARLRSLECLAKEFGLDLHTPVNL